MFAEINKPCKFILRSIGRGYKHSSYGNIWECKKVMEKDGINQRIFKRIIKIAKYHSSKLSQPCYIL